MRISVFGLGYVGTVSAGCLARDGHDVIAVDPVGSKVNLINRGASPIVEREIDQILERTHRAGRLWATTDAADAVSRTDMSIICVGTPSKPNGCTDFRYVRRVCEEIGTSLASKTSFHVVVARSTMIPGSTGTIVIPALEMASERRAGDGFGVCYHPEFLREGSGVADYDDPPKALFGATDEHSGQMLRNLYKHMNLPVYQVDMVVAELVKYVDNVWHALKVCFANEMGVLARAIGVDGRDLMEIFCADTKLNISPQYLRPGFAFGGSCLPKDIRAATCQSQRLDLRLPVLNSILLSNERHIERAVSLIREQGAKDLGFLGISFKEGTDDLRESPIVEVIERLLGKGYNIRLYDRRVNIAALVGANREYILNHLPHLSKLIEREMQAVLDHARVVIIGHRDREFSSVPDRLRPDQILVDLVGVCRGPPSEGQYRGLCW
jgi:GDP-mannose 6-dehydrogenase